MKLKRMLAALLALAAVFTLAAAPAQASSFPDVTDPAMARAVSTLQSLGIVNGMEDGTFQPNSALTRVQFCKMAIEIMGRGDEAKAQMSRTIFTDVTSTHWGRGYVNLAATMKLGDGSNARLMMGTGSGRFEPDRDISYQEAVTLILRMLGYNDDANRAWPVGALQLSVEMGLENGLGITNPAAALSRGQAAILFCRLLSTPSKGGKTPYAAGLGTLVEDTIVLSADTTINGQTGWVVTTSGTYRAAGSVDSTIVGQRGAALLNKDGRFITLLTDSSLCVTATVARVQGYYLHTAAGVRYTFEDSTPVYTGASGEVSTFAAASPGILAGDAVTIYLDSNGKVIGMFCNLGSGSAEGKFLVVQGPVSYAGLASLTGSDYNYTIRKNGSVISMSDINTYDVLTYDAVSKVLNVCDVRLFCYYENASPSPKAPTVITAAGGNEFTVMADAMDSIARFSLGQSFTLLFTADGRVAGAAGVGTGGTTGGWGTGGWGTGSYYVSGNAMGLVSGNNLSLLGTRVTLKLDNAVPSASTLNGQLVSVSSAMRGQLSLSSAPMFTGGVYSSASRTLGGYPVSESVRVYKKSADGTLTASDLSALPATVTGGYLSYHLNAARQVDLIIFTDTTGDGLTYGRIDPTSTVEEVPVKGKDGDKMDADGNKLDDNGKVITEKKTIAQLIFTTPDGRSTTYNLLDGVYAAAGFGTITLGHDADGNEVVTFYSLLQQVNNVRSADFYEVNGVTYVQVNGRTYEVSSNVICYNAAASYGVWGTGSDGQPTYRLQHVWFKSLLEARSYSSTMAIFLDASGQKVHAVSVGA